MAPIIAKAQKKKQDAAAELVREFLSDKYKGDWVIRKTVHQDLDMMQNPETELLCTCRNVLVHKRGHDEFDEIAAAIKQLGQNRALIGAQGYPPRHMPISLNDEKNLVMNDAVGKWAAEFMQQQIFTMDQNFANIYQLPRKIWDFTRIGRVFPEEPSPPTSPRQVSKR